MAKIGNAKAERLSFSRLYATPRLGKTRTAALEQTVDGLGSGAGLQPLCDVIYQDGDQPTESAE